MSLLLITKLIDQINISSKPEIKQSLQTTLKKKNIMAKSQNKKELSIDMTKLPPNLKMRIFSLFSGSDPTLSISQSKLSAPPHVFDLNNLNTKYLSFFSVSDLHALQKKGFLIKDGFLNGQSNFFEKYKYSEMESKFVPKRNTIKKILASKIPTTTALLKAAQKLNAQGLLDPAGMKGADKKWRNTSIRGDHRAWIHIEDIHLPLEVRFLLCALDELRSELNHAAGFNCRKTESQLAMYSNGNRYARHMDTFEGGPARRLTLLYYFNEWKKDNGGQLRLYLKDGQKDVAPVADRLLIFLSSWVEHEVLPAHAPRFAITSWFA